MTNKTTGNKIVKFDPTFNVGSIFTVISIFLAGAGVYSALRAEQVEQKVKVQAVVEIADKDRQQTNRDISDIKADVKELRQATAEIKESIAVLRGRAAAEQGGRK